MTPMPRSSPLTASSRPVRSLTPWPSPRSREAHAHATFDHTAHVANGIVTPSRREPRGAAARMARAQTRPVRTVLLVHPRERELPAVHAQVGDHPVLALHGKSDFLLLASVVDLEDDAVVAGRSDGVRYFLRSHDDRAPRELDRQQVRPELCLRPRDQPEYRALLVARWNLC